MAIDLKKNKVRNLLVYPTSDGIFWRFFTNPWLFWRGQQGGEYQKELACPQLSSFTCLYRKCYPEKVPTHHIELSGSHPEADTAAPQLQPVACGPDENAIKPILDRANLSLLITDSQRTSTRDVMSEVSPDANCLVRVPFFFSNLCFLFEITIFLN